MGRGKTVSFLRGKRVRATKLNASGAPLIGDSSVVVSKGFITIGMTTNTEDGEAISQVNANGESCILETAVPSFTGIGVEIEFCGVDFSLFEMITGNAAVLDDSGIVVGITESTDVNLGAVNFALEMWLGVTTDSAPVTGSQGQFGYVLLPRLGGGVISDISVENGAINFTLTGMTTKNGSLWGVGPYKVDLTAGVPSTLRRAIKAERPPPHPDGRGRSSGCLLRRTAAARPGAPCRDGPDGDCDRQGCGPQPDPRRHGPDVVRLRRRNVGLRGHRLVLEDLRRGWHVHHHRVPGPVLLRQDRRRRYLDAGRGLRNRGLR